MAASRLETLTMMNAAWAEKSIHAPPLTAPAGTLEIDMVYYDSLVVSVLSKFPLLFTDFLTI
jgi:hypothetical protein